MAYNSLYQIDVPHSGLNKWESIDSNSVLWNKKYKSAQRIENQSPVLVPKLEDDKRNGLFSKLFKK